MENGRFVEITNTKKGKIVGKIQFENGKTMDVPPYYQLVESLRDKDCQVQRKNGQIVKISVDGKELQTKGSKSPSSKWQVASNRPRSAQRSGSRRGVPSKRQYRTGTPKKDEKEAATAPYNFIPLNHCVVEADFNPDEVFNDSYYAEKGDRFSGRIELDLKNVTPLYVRGTGGTEHGKENTKENSDFFSPGGRIKIPGSSLRGMTRMMVEIVSWGKFTFFDDRLLYYRAVAERNSLGNEYQKNMAPVDSDEGTAEHKFNAGYLKRDGFDYYIVPTLKESGKQFRQILYDDLPKGYANKQFTYEKRNDGKYLVMSGKMPKKKRHWLINAPDYNASRVNIPKEDIKAYENDDNRFTDKKQQNDRNKKDGDLLRQLEVSQDRMVPCFYVCWKDSRGKDRVSFGHTGFFRLAYKKSIGDHIPSEINESDKIDIPEALFGKETEFATRVFFEDAEILPDQQDVVMDALSPKILSNPKPTTFQHYLEQQTQDIQKLKHWNDQTNIRGHKLYWHKDINNDSGYWKEPNIINDSQHTVIRPVKPKTRFRGCIRFENLSEVELGALLFSLDLPENHYHKLGMSKPLGLGSVKITSKLIISDRRQRYEKLFSNGMWELGEREQDIDGFKDKFEKFVLEKIQRESPLNSLWETERLRQLKIMLDWENTQKPRWLENTKYIDDLEVFKERRILPKPEALIRNMVKK